MPKKTAILLYLTLILASGPFADTQKRILFINSYHKGYAWSDDVERGLIERVNGSRQDIDISFEYLDSKRFAFADLAPTIAESLKIKYRDYQPDVVVASDNTAFSFMKEWRASLFPGVPLVFCGYNNLTADALAGMSDVTGVNEENDLVSLVNLAVRVQPALTTLAFVVSSTDETMRAIYEAVLKTVYPRFKNGFNVVILNDESFKAIKDRLSLLPKTTAVFLAGQTSDMGEGRALSPEENVAMIANFSKFPCYTLWEFQLGSGTLGGIMIRGRDQGAAAADMALQILSGTPADSIPPLMSTPATVEFDWKVMGRFGIRTSDLPGGSVIVNKPDSPWSVWPIQATGILVLVFAETISILMLLKLVRSRRSALKELAEEQRLLERRVQERTAELTAANERLQIASETDPLTALSNRGAFSRKFEQEFSRLRRSGGLLSLIMLDIDHFKRFNDTYGHLEGDECLIKVAGVIAAAVHRPYDLAARFGGEEFIIILPETDLEGAFIVAEKVRDGIAALSIPHATSETSGYLTVSMGVLTAVPFREDKPLALVDMVDGIMYKAKNSGRDRIETVDLSREYPPGDKG